jgi:hypothetical protein
MDLAPVTADDIIRILNANNARLKDVIFDVVPRIPTERTCPCATALANARLKDVIFDVVPMIPADRTCPCATALASARL